MNFKVVDGDSDYMSRVDEFVNLYSNSDINVKEVRKEMDISPRVYYILRRHCLDNNLIVERKMAVPHPTRPYVHINRKSGFELFDVVKSGEYYGTYKDLDTANFIVKELEKMNWNKDRLGYIKRKLLK